MRDQSPKFQAIPAALLCFALASCGGGSGSGSSSSSNSDDAGEVPREQTPVVTSEPVRPLELRWSTDSQGWNKSILFHPDGDVLAFEKGRLLVLARDTGAILDQFRSCDLVTDGAFWLPDGRIVLVCEQGVQVLYLPGGKLEMLLSLGQAPEVAHMASGMLALAAGKRVLLIDTDSWKTLESFDLPYAVRDMAISPDGTQIAVATHDRFSTSGAGNLLLVERGGAQRELHAGPAQAVAFSSDGQTLFAGVSGFDGFFIDVASGEKRSQVRTGSWLKTAAFMTPERVAATGSDGLVLYELGGDRSPTVLAKGSAEGMAADANRVCVGERSGPVHCFSRDTLEPSIYVAVPDAREQSAKPAPELKSEGTSGVFGTGSRQLSTITAVSGDRVVLSAADNFPPVGSMGTLFKQVQQKLGSSEINIWLDIARAKVLESGDGAVTLQVVEEHTVLTVNGRKKSHFTEGAMTRFEW